MRSFNKLYLFCSLICVFVVFRASMVNTYLFAKEPMLASLSTNYFWNPVQFAPNQTLIGSDSSAIQMYRENPQHDAVFKVRSTDFDLINIWNQRTLNVGIHSASKASVIGEAGKFYFGTDSSWFHCIDSRGNVLWQTFLADSPKGIHSTAVMDRDSIYVGSYRGSLYSLDKESGRIRWKSILGNTIGASPTPIGNHLLVSVEIDPPNGYLVLVEKSSGDVVWKSEFLGEQSHSSPALSLDGKIAVLGANNSTVQAFDLSTGKKLWEVKMPGPVKSSPLVVGNSVFVSTWRGGFFSIEVPTGKVIWSYELAEGSQVSPVFLSKSGLVVVADKSGTIYALNAASGKLDWKSSYPSKQMSSPIVVQGPKDEKVLVACTEGQICLIDSKGQLKRSWKTPGHFTGSPLISDNQLVMSFDNGWISSWSLRFNR